MPQIVRKFARSRFNTWKYIILTGLFLAAIYYIYPSLFLGKYFFKENLLRIDKASQIIDRKNRVISELFSTRYGSLEADKLPEKMSKVLLYVEDSRFFYHFGLDPISIVRAFFKNVFSGSYKQGGSTITQQYARIILNDRSKNLRRKVTEAVLALIIEWKLDKEEILAEYMNRVYLGHGAHGFQNAAFFYFNKDLDDLNLFECALLASLPSAPNRYSPLKYINKSFSRVRIVAESIRDDEPDFASGEELEALYKQMSSFYGKLNRSPTETIFGRLSARYPTVTEYVRGQLVKTVGNEAIYSGGYKIYTTIDLDYQSVVEKVTEKYIRGRRKDVRPKLALPEDKDRKKKYLRKLRAGKLKRAFSDKRELYSILGLLGGADLQLYDEVESLRFRGGIGQKAKNSLQASVVGIEANTGRILFVKGGVGFSPKNQFNRAFNGYRQTGSAIKPVIYSTAIENGILHTTSLLNDSPKFYFKALGDEKDWLPENFDYVYKGEVTVRQALARSINIPAILTAEKTGMENLADNFRQFFLPR